MDPRKSGKERERKREKHQSVTSHMLSDQELDLQPWLVP